MKVLSYRSQKSPIQEFIKSLDKKDRAKIIACLKSIEESGFESPRVQFRQIRGKLWEIKIKAATAGYRVFYITIQKDTILLLHAYKKQSQKTPLKEITIAEKRMLEIITNENHYIN